MSELEVKYCYRGSTALALYWSSAEQGVHSQLSGQCAGPEAYGKDLQNRLEPLDHWDTALRLWSSRSFQFQEVHIAKDQVYEDIQECHTSTSGNKYLGWLAIQHNWVASEFQTCQFYAWNGLKAAPANPGHTIKTPILFFSIKHLSNNTNLD